MLASGLGLLAQLYNLMGMHMMPGNSKEEMEMSGKEKKSGIIKSCHEVLIDRK